MPRASPDRIAAAELAREQRAPCRLPVTMTSPTLLGSQSRHTASIAWEIETWNDRLVTGLFGAVADAGVAEVT